MHFLFLSPSLCWRFIFQRANFYKFCKYMSTCKYMNFNKLNSFRIVNISLGVYILLLLGKAALSYRVKILVFVLCKFLRYVWCIKIMETLIFRRVWINKFKICLILESFWSVLVLSEASSISERKNTENLAFLNFLRWNFRFS